MSQAPAWWEEVEHLREAAERRIAERECAQREGREPIALTPLRPLSDAERGTAAPEHPAGAPTPLAAAPKVREGRFRRATAALGAQGPRPAAHHVATASRSAPTAGALALDFAVQHEPMADPWTAPAPAERPRHHERELVLIGGAARAPRPALDESAERLTRREKLARLAQEQQHAAATAARARATD